MKTVIIVLSLIMHLQGICSETSTYECSNNEITICNDNNRIEPYINISLNSESDQLFINGNSSAYQYTLSDYNGKQLICVRVDANQFHISIESLKAGYYYITVVGKDRNVKIEKFRKI